MDVDRLLDRYTAGWHAAARVPDASDVRVRIPEVVQRWYANNRTCAGCLQPIKAQHEVRGVSIYHPSCAKRAATAVSTQTLGVIRGRALLFDEWCTVYTHRGETYELYVAGCFGSSTVLARLRVDHGSVDVPGTLALVPNAVGLDFSFVVHDSAFGREVLRWMQAGECRGCSVKYRPVGKRWDDRYNGERIVAGDLIEISLCRHARPASIGTYARVV